MSLASREYRTVTRIAGPLLFLRNIHQCAIGEMVVIRSGEAAPSRRGQVLEISEDHVVIQVLEETVGLDVKGTSVLFTGEGPALDLSPGLLGRVFNGLGRPIDGGTIVRSDTEVNVNGLPINPVSRKYPRDFIQTGISAIDGMNTLIRGQKLPIFSGNVLPHK